jgi:hypothetical protein
MIASGAGHIFRTFLVSEEEARRIAVDYVDLIEAKGGDPTNFSAQQFTDLLTKELSRRYEWRIPAAKMTWEQEQRNAVDGYNSWIESRRPSPFKKW